jgi:hypothetical protein
MRKSAIKPTDIVQSANSTRAKNNAPAHPANRSRSKCSDWQPSSWPFRPEDASPLAWWRTMPADLLRDAEQLVLRETIRKVGVLKGCEWVSAMRGDVPAGIAIALEVMPITTITLEVDLAMTTLMLGALAGSAASALVLSQVLQRTSFDHPFAKELSVSWLALNLRRAIATTKRSLKACSQADSKDARYAEVQTFGMGA